MLLHYAFIKQHNCSQLPTYADNVALPAFAVCCCSNWLLSFLPAGLTAANLQQHDGLIDTTQFHRLSSAYCVCLMLWCCWLGGRKGIRPVKNWVVGCWRGYMSGEVQTCIWPSWCHCHSLSLASVKSRLVLPFWYWLSWVVPDKGPLNACVCVLCILCTQCY